jgi:hypothetical protein
MHKAEPGAGGGMHGAMHGAMHGDGGMHAEHAARHAAIDRLVATLDIEQLKARYVRCIDTKDLACLRDTVFTPHTELYFKGVDYEIAVKGWPEIEKFYQGAFTPPRRIREGERRVAHREEQLSAAVGRDDAAQQEDEARLEADQGVSAPAPPA